VPDTLDLTMVDRVELVTNEEAIDMARRLAKEEGILSGISCGGAVAVAVRIAQEKDMKGKTIVAVLPDSGERYLSSPLFDGMFVNRKRARDASDPASAEDYNKGALCWNSFDKILHARLATTGRVNSVQRSRAPRIVKV